MSLDILKKIAPTVAAALGGPMAGLAVDAIGKAFGWEAATKQKVEDFLTQGQMSGEDVSKIRMAEIELIRQERELGFKFAELEVKDRQHEHEQTQDTIRSGDNAEDPYVRHTRPMMARQSWYAMVLYVGGMEIWKAVQPAVQGADWELALIIGAPALTYMGFRSLFDNVSLPKVGGMFKRKA